MLWNVRTVDDGRLRRRICEGLLVCNTLQGLIVLRAIFTENGRDDNDNHSTTTQQQQSHRSNNNNVYNWFIFILLTGMAVCYGRFRFGRGGNLIKIYELPTSALLR
jgi:hypothetical protein